MIPRILSSVALMLVLGISGCLGNPPAASSGTTGPALASLCAGMGAGGNSTQNAAGPGSSTATTATGCCQGLGTAAPGMNTTQNAAGPGSGAPGTSAATGCCDDTQSATAAGANSTQNAAGPGSGVPLSTLCCPGAMTANVPGANTTQNAAGPGSGSPSAPLPAGCCDGNASANPPGANATQNAAGPGPGTPGPSSSAACCQGPDASAPPAANTTQNAAGPGGGAAGPATACNPCDATAPNAPAANATQNAAGPGPGPSVPPTAAACCGGDAASNGPGVNTTQNAAGPGSSSGAACCNGAPGSTTTQNAAGPGSGTTPGNGCSPATLCPPPASCAPCSPYPVSNCLLGLQWDGTHLWFAKVNPATGVDQPVAAVPNGQYTQQGNNALDPQGHRFFARVSDPSFVSSLVAIDTGTGAVLSSVPWPAQFADPHYDSVNGDLVGLRWDGATEWLARVNPSTGVLTTVAAITGVNFVQQGDTALDAAGHRLFAWATGPSLPATLLTLDSNTGALLASAPWPAQFSNPEYDAVNADLVGLQWDGANQWFVRVNPTTAVVSSLAILPGVQFTQPGHGTLDAQGHRFFVYGGGPSLPDSLLTVDSNTGLVTASIPWPSQFTYPEYDG